MDGVHLPYQVLADVVHMHPINGFNTKSLTLNHFAMVHTSHLVLTIQGVP